MPARYAAFPTSWGACAIAWTERGIAAVQLPGESEQATVEALLAGHLRDAEPGEAPAFARETMRRIAEHLAGRPQRFDDVPADFDGAALFHRRIWQAARALAPGETAAYGELAERAGAPGAARAAGQAMACNRMPLIVPCHRVIAAGGRPGGYGGFGGMRTKERLLALEGVSLRRKASLFGGAGSVSFDARAAVKRLRAADLRLAAIIDQIGPFRLQLEKLHSAYESLFEAIVYQQLSGKAAAAILGRVQALFDPLRTPTPRQILEAKEEPLRCAGLSRPKIAALKDLSAKALDGTVPDLATLTHMSDEAIVERLTEVRGIGRWTVQMLLIFRLGRQDVLPSEDLGLRKGFAVMLGKRALPTPAEVERRGQRWRPLRTVASWYLWRAGEL